MGTDVSSIFENVELHWLTHDTFAPGLQLEAATIQTGECVDAFSNPVIDCQVIGGPDSEQTRTLLINEYRNGLLDGEPLTLVSEFAGLHIASDNGIRMLDVRSWMGGSDPLQVLLFDANGNFLDDLIGSFDIVPGTGITGGDGTGQNFSQFDFRGLGVASVLIGGESATQQIQGLTVNVPEPASLVLLLAGLGLLVGMGATQSAKRQFGSSSASSA